MNTRNGIARALVVAGCVLWLSACGGSSGSGGSSASTVAAQLQALVASGALPTLDVSSSVTGTDADSNGVRDDIDAIIRAQSDTGTQKAALTQFAQSIQATLTLDATNSSAVSAAAGSVRTAVACLFTQYDGATAAKRARWIQEISINTMVRLQAYDKFNAVMSGTVTPAATGAVCNA
jgi:hypothetical protein